MGYPVSFPSSSLSELFVFHLCFAKGFYQDKAQVPPRNKYDAHPNKNATTFSLLPTAIGATPACATALALGAHRGSTRMDL
jgi:hypothetical protein